nr:hypothetical protein [Tanacetum cinerariifolium]
MVLPNNQVSSPNSVPNDKAFENSSNDSDFNVNLYLNDEEDNDNNVFIPQTSNLKEENMDMFSSFNEAIKLMLSVATNMSCVVENNTRKEESKDNLKEYNTLKVLNMVVTLKGELIHEHLEGDALDLGVLMIRAELSFEQIIPKNVRVCLFV